MMLRKAPDIDRVHDMMSLSGTACYTIWRLGIDAENLCGALQQEVEPENSSYLCGALHQEVEPENLCGALQQEVEPEKASHLCGALHQEVEPENLAEESDRHQQQHQQRMSNSISNGTGRLWAFVDVWSSVHWMMGEGAAASWDDCI